jgi:protein-S-isoprenylcysteine O-methyltransferase Ste14
MIGFTKKWLQIEFEGRIFISFGIVVLIAGLSFWSSANATNTLVLLGNWIGLTPQMSIRAGYLFIAGIMAGATLLRMWAGSVLTSDRMMAFKIRKDRLATNGPYRWIRNPIYLADLTAFCGFALSLKPVGLLLPVLLYLHYRRLVRYEETALKGLGSRFDVYMSSAPRFFPSLRVLKEQKAAIRSFHINKDGFRHNSLYLLFIPGFIVASFTGSLIFAIAAGLPAVADWAVLHTLKGLAPKSNARITS